jgi:23S rRNA (cytidine1920-2'-O)/16S rRNA (cytidine1409-2'-O)-methyltransferase
VSGRTRLDVALVEQGLAESRARAQALIMAGRVTVDGAVVDKAGAPVKAGAGLAVTEPPRYVSRGGEKLETAIRQFGIDVRAERCLDAGSSTGGFTDCLLQHGAAAVAAVDVGRAQLHERLRADPRVTVLEGVNARTLDPQQLPFRPTLITADVSFISLRLVLPAVLEAAADQWRAVLLVKPQFEAGPKDVRRGVVRDPAVRERVLHDLADFVTSRGAVILGVCDSSLPGPAGNREYLMYVASPGHPVSRERQADVSAEIRAAVHGPDQPAGEASGGGGPRPAGADRGRAPAPPPGR